MLVMSSMHPFASRRRTSPCSWCPTPDMPRRLSSLDVLSLLPTVPSMRAIPQVGSLSDRLICMIVRSFQIQNLLLRLADREQRQPASNKVFRGQCSILVRHLRTIEVKAACRNSPVRLCSGLDQAKRDGQFRQRGTDCSVSACHYEPCIVFQSRQDIFWCKVRDVRLEQDTSGDFCTLQAVG